jgi:AcrR family transcriptional regulator
MQDEEWAGLSQAERILWAAGAVFLEKGFDAATTLDIAARARVSKRDLYRRFASKPGMLEALIAAHSNGIATPVELAADPVDLERFLEVLRAFGTAFLAGYLDAHKIALYRVAIAEAPASAHLGKTLEAAGAGPVIASLTEFIAKAVARGIVAAPDADLVMSVYFSVLIGPWQIGLLTGTRTPPDADTLQAQADKAVEVIRRVIKSG